MSIYDDLQAVSSQLLGEFKQGVVRYVEVSVSNIAPDEPDVVTEVLHTVNAVAKGVSFKFIDQTTILSSDKQVVIPGNVPYVPDEKGFVEIDQVRYKIIRVDAVPSAGTPVIYRVFIRT